MAQSTMILPFSLEGISHSTTQSVMLCVALSKLIPTLVIGRPDTMILPFSIQSKFQDYFEGKVRDFCICI